MIKSHTIVAGYKNVTREQCVLPLAANSLHYIAGYKNVTQKHEVTYFRTRQRPHPLRVTKIGGTTRLATTTFLGYKNVTQKR